MKKIKNGKKKKNQVKCENIEKQVKQKKHGSNECRSRTKNEIVKTWFYPSFLQYHLIFLFLIICFFIGTCLYFHFYFYSYFHVYFRFHSYSSSE